MLLRDEMQKNRTSIGVRKTWYENGENGQVEKNCPRLKNQELTTRVGEISIKTMNEIQELSIVTGTFLITTRMLEYLCFRCVEKYS